MKGAQRAGETWFVVYSLCPVGVVGRGMASCTCDLTRIPVVRDPGCLEHGGGWSGDRYQTVVANARRYCGCTQCLGGYALGEYTINIEGGGVAPQRPSSCVAGVLLEHGLRILESGGIG